MRTGADVVFCGFSCDYWPDELWQQDKDDVLRESRHGAWVPRPTYDELVAAGVRFRRYDLSSDLVPWPLISRVLTELGSLESKHFLEAAVQEGRD